jgi:hypothetical protein
MKQYKVVKEFGCAKKGDIFNESAEGYFEMDSTSECVDMYSSRNMCVSSNIISTLLGAQFIEELKSETEEKTPTQDKLTSISNFINEMKKQYEQDHQNLINEYNEGNLPACVKVEADTVYFNMNKVLTKIEDLINE